MMKIKIGSKSYDVIVAETEDDQIKGLQDVEKMEDNEGMLFIYDEPEDEISFWMKDTSIHLDIIFINEDLIVTSVQKGIPNSDELLTDENIQYVLEVNTKSGIKEGDELEFEEDIKLSPNKIYVIGPDGKPQMELEGNERIFSRPNTKVLVNMAKKAYVSKSDNDYKKLGKQMFKYLDIQNSNKQEYVQKKDE